MINGEFEKRVSRGLMRGHCAADVSMARRNPTSTRTGGSSLEGRWGCCESEAKLHKAIVLLIRPC